jgi:hypothetical protein
MGAFGRCTRGSMLSACVIALIQVAGAASAAQKQSREVEERSRIAAASLEDAIVVDCQLPGSLQKLGGMRTYLTPGKLLRLSAVDCRSRGGEYTLGDLSSGTLSLKRWLPLAEQGDAEAQYYVARIYANGMDGVPVDYARAVTWYQKAAQQQYQSALQELGYMYEQGLGVERDTLQALNLQRQAAGLGAELDYAWKITEAKEEAARQVAALTDQLELSNAEIEALRGQVASTNDALFRSRADLNRSETALLDLKEQLQAVNESVAAVDTAHVEELQRTLATKEQALAQARAQVESLTAQARQQQRDLNERLARTQLSSYELSELLANEQEKNRSLVAQAAQTEQRLQRSQQELAALRDRYRAEVEQWADEREEYERATEKNKDAGAALVAAAERDLERQKLRVASLERALAEARSAPRQKDDSEAIRNKLKDLQARYQEQQQKFDRQRADLAALRKKSDAERKALVQQMNEQAVERAAELQEKEQRLASLSSEVDTLRSSLSRLRAQHEREASQDASELSQAREAKRMLEARFAQESDHLQRLQTERATEVRKLTEARATLEKQLASVQRTSQVSQTKVAFLEQDLVDRRRDIEAKDAEIARLQKRLDDQTKQLERMAATVPAGAPKATAPVSKGGAEPYLADPGTLRQGKYHALVIGNSDYTYLKTLNTPTQDAKDLAKVLEERYGFQVRLLNNATSEQMMKALHEETLELQEEDSLLIYYSGQGDATGTPGRAFWLGVDADPVTRKGWLEADHVRAKIKEMKAKHVLLVVDSCFSDALIIPNTMTIGRGLNATRLRVQLNRRARMVLTSGQVPPIPDNLDAGRHSIFARQLLQILRQQQKVMSGEMLSYKLTEHLQQAAQAEKIELRRKPTYSALKDANHDVGDFFFMPTPEPMRVAGL